MIKKRDINSIQGLISYNQYAQNGAIVQFFKLLKQRLYNDLHNKLDLLNQISWQFQGDNTYLSFFYINLYGFQQGFGEPLIKNLFDEGKEYDKGFKYDDAEFDGKLPLPLYKILIQYFMDYSQDCFTPSWLTSFIQDFCGVDATEYSIEGKANGVKVTITRTEESVLMQRVFLDLQRFNMIPIDRIYFNLVSTFKPTKTKPQPKAKAKAKSTKRSKTTNDN